MKVVRGALDNDGQLKANVDYNALLGLLGEVLGARTDELQRLLNTAGRIVIDPSGIKPSDIVRDIGGVVAGDDADVRNLINAFGGVLDAIEGMNEAQRRKTTSPTRYAIGPHLQRVFARSDGQKYVWGRCTALKQLTHRVKRRTQSRRKLHIHGRARIEAR